MPSQRKPPVEKSNRPDGGPLPEDSGGFSIETTTMRLKSLRLRRAETANPETGTAATGKHDSAPAPAPAPRSGPSGRVRHDERGVAVWDWAVASGEFATLSTTVALKKLEVADLQIEDHKPADLKPAVSGRDKAGGFDPYNQRGSGKRQGESAQRQGITGSVDRDRAGVLDQLLGKDKKK